MEEESKLKYFLHKAFVLFALVVLLFLFLSYLGPGWRILNVLEGQAASESLEEGVVEFKGYSIEFEEGVYGELKTMYFDNLDKEFNVCLFGEKEGKTFLLMG